jgi:hypothetical protein
VGVRICRTVVETEAEEPVVSFRSRRRIVGDISGDLAIVCSHSGLASMMSTAKQFAPVAVDFYGELVEANPQAFDSFARQARLFT